jgi:hypothetical protein
MPVIRSQVVADPAQGAGPSSGIVANSLPGVKEEEMLLAAPGSYSLLNIFWTMFIFFLQVLWIWILIMVFIDIFRSHDLSG